MSINKLKYIGLLSILICCSATSQEMWRGLVLAEENRCSDYDKHRQYPYPQSVEDEIVASMGGKVYGPYTGRYFVSDTETDIEHIVAASEGHDSGLCSASDEKRIEFATDLLNLTLAAPEVNRCNNGGKCAYDAAEWLPAKNQCWFANRVILIKQKYQLSVDKAEALALENIVSKCESFDMVFYTNGELANPIEPPIMTDPLVKYDDNNNGRISCSEAKAHGIAPVLSNHPAYQYMQDRDRNGIVCE